MRQLVYVLERPANKALLLDDEAADPASFGARKSGAGLQREERDVVQAGEAAIEVTASLNLEGSSPSADMRSFLRRRALSVPAWRLSRCERSG